MGTSDIFAGVLTGTLRPDIPADMHPDWAALMKVRRARKQMGACEGIYIQF